MMTCEVNTNHVGKRSPHDTKLMFEKGQQNRDQQKVTQVNK